MRRLLVPAALALALAAVAGPDAELVATDRAEEALAAGDPDRAARLLEEVLPRLPDDAARARVRCLLGDARLAGGDPRRAEAVLAEVPIEASCGRRAAWQRSSALQALGRVEEAAPQVESLGEVHVGPDRDGATAESFAALARRLLADPERGRDQGLGLLALALDFKISDVRARDLARELADAWLEDPDTVNPSAAACDGLVRGLLLAEDEQDRRRAARLCEGTTRDLLIEGVTDEAARSELRAWRAPWDSAMVDTARRRALALRPDPTLAGTLARWLEGRSSLDARELLRAEATADAERRAILLAGRAGRWSVVVEEAGTWLGAHPTDRERATVEGARAVALLALAREAERAGRHDDALRLGDELVERHAGTPEAAEASFEAGIVARAAGRADEAERRWEETRARFPSTGAADLATVALARQRAFDEGDLEGALALLRSWSSESWAASVELERLQDTAVWITSEGASQGDPTVRLGTRDLERVELRLHRVDPEAFALAGGSPETLRDLDVAAIAPDRTWTVEVPGYKQGADLSFETRVPVPGPGLYAVTVVGAGEEARALVSVTDLQAVVRTVGPDTAVGVFDVRGRPVGGAQVWLVGRERIEGRTDGTGLFVHRGKAAEEAVVLVQQGRSWAMTPVVHTADPPASGLLQLTVEVDRPVWLEGDRVGARLVARRDGRPVRGTWKAWLEVDGQALAGLEVEADERGAAAFDLPLPSLAADGLWRLVGAAPGEAEARELAGIRVTRRERGSTTLAAEMDGSGVVLTATGTSGEPLGDVPIVLDGRTVRTDATGRARVEGPPPHLPWSVSASVPGTGLAAYAARAPTEDERLELRLAEDRLRPGESASLQVAGAGPLELVVVRRLEEGVPPAPLEDPWVAVPDTGLRGFGPVPGDLPPDPTVLEETVLRRVVEGPGPVVVPAEILTPGRYELRLARLDGRAASLVRELVVDAVLPRVTGARDVGLGDTLELTPDGGPALLTAQTDRLLWAAVRASGRTAEATADASWRGGVLVAATGRDGEVHARRIEADPDPVVTLKTEPDGEGVRLVAMVRDSRGEPVDAEVSFAAWDRRLLAVVGLPVALDAAELVPEGYPEADGAWAGLMRDGDEGDPISAALLAEDELRRERALAASAGVNGLLSDNALAEAMKSESVVMGLGGMGAKGMGGGGSGYGSGGGAFGGVSGGHVGGVPRRALPGVRERVLWSLVRTVGGRAEVKLEGPAALYDVRATAVSTGGVRSVTEEVDLRGRVWMVAPSPGAGALEDTASPRVTVVNGTGAPYQGTLTVGTEQVPVKLGAGEVTSVSTEARPAGPAVVDIALSGTSARASWSFPLAAVRWESDGPLEVVVADVGGHAAVGTIALREPPDEGWTAGQLASAGRAALAAHAITPDERLRARVREIRDLLRWWQGSAPGDHAAVGLFLVEARRSGVIPVSDAEVDRALDAVVSQGTLTDRLWAAVALAEGGRPPSAEILAQLAAEKLDGRSQTALLARALRVSGQAGAERLLYGPVPNFDLEAERIRAGHGSQAGWGGMIMPRVGDPYLPDWILVAGSPRPAGKVRVGGSELAPGALVVVRAGTAIEGPVTRWPAGGLAGSAGDPKVLRHPRLYRLPAGFDGALAEPSPTSEEGCAPCVLNVGDGLYDPERSLAGGGLQPGADGVFVATAPGTFTLGGAPSEYGPFRPVQVQVVAGDEPLSPVPATAALDRARHLREAGVASELPTTVADELTARLAMETFHQALLADDDARIARTFRALVATAPESAVDLSDVARAARALRATGEGAAAIRAWRAAVDASFVAEVAGISAAEPQVGLLVVLQRTREAALRYPDGAAVGDALYVLPGRLLEAADQGLPAEALGAGLTATDARLTAAAWDRAFLAAHHDHPLATAAGLRLGRTLLTLHASGPAATWARRVNLAHPGDPQEDALVFLEALALTEDGEATRAEPLLRALAEDPFPDASGVPHPSDFAADARMALGRLEESRGRYDAALEVYRSVEAEEARQAAAVLTSRSLTAPQLVRLGAGEQAVVEVEARGVDRVSLRAYRVDLRTLFLRDGGLAGVKDVRVDGVSPVWSDTRSLRAGPFPETRSLPLPLSGLGAWLVQIDGDDVRATVVVVRSDLRLAVDDSGPARRVDLRRGSSPVGGAEVRGLAGATVYPAVTDVRGVAEVPSGAPVLAWSGEAVAFTDPTLEVEPAYGAPARGSSRTLDVLDERLEGQRALDEERWRDTLQRASEALPLHGL